MKQPIFYLFLSSLTLIFAFLTSDVQAQRRYRHIKKARTVEGFVQKVDPSEKKNTEKEIKNPLIETPSVERFVTSSELVVADAEKTPASLEIASADNTLTITPRKVSNRKKSIREKQSPVSTDRLHYSEKAMSTVGLNKMASPDKVQGKPGLAFIIMGSVFLGVGFIFMIVSIVLLGLGSILGFIGLLILSIILLSLGTSFLPIGIVKLIKFKRGR
jgi:predicted phage tail protein